MKHRVKYVDIDIDVSIDTSSHAVSTGSMSLQTVSFHVMRGRPHHLLLEEPSAVLFRSTGVISTSLYFNG